MNFIHFFCIFFSHWFESVGEEHVMWHVFPDFFLHKFHHSLFILMIKWQKKKSYLDRWFNQKIMANQIDENKQTKKTIINWLNSHCRWRKRRNRKNIQQFLTMDTITLLIIIILIIQWMIWNEMISICSDDISVCLSTFVFILKLKM